MQWNYSNQQNYWIITKGDEILFTAKDEAWAAHLVEILETVDYLVESNERRKRAYDGDNVIPFMEKYRILGISND